MASPIATESGEVSTVPSTSPTADCISHGIQRRGLLALVGDGAVKRPRLPMLAGVIDRLTGSLSAHFRKLSRGNAEARATDPNPIRFAEFLGSVPASSLVAVFRLGAWNGQCLAAIDGDLVHTALGVLLGDRRGPGMASARRGYTAIERAVVERLARTQIAPGLAGAFAPVTECGVALDYLATGPSEATIALPPASCLTWRVTLTLEAGEGSIAFLLPYAAIEPIRAHLARDPAGQGQDRDPLWRAHLQSELPHAAMPLRAVIESRRVAASEVMRWRPGSVLQLHRHHEEPIDVCCKDLLILRARMAEQDGRIALHVDERRLAEDWPGDVPGAS